MSLDITATRQQSSSTWTVWSDGSEWHAQNYRTGNHFDGQDPVALINNLLAVALAGDVVTVLGNFSSSTTLNFNTVPVIYRHYGVHTYTGTGDAIVLNITAAAVYATPTVDAREANIYVNTLIGPNTVSPFNANPNAIGVHVKQFVQSFLQIQELQYFTEGIRMDLSAGNVAPDNEFKLNIQVCNIGVHYIGTAAVNFQGNWWYLKIFSCAQGVAIESTVANESANLAYYFGTIDNANGPGGATDYINGKVETNQNILILDFIRVPNSIFGLNDLVISAENKAFQIPLLSAFAGIVTKGLGLSAVYGLDNRSGLTVADGAAITLYSVPAANQVFRASIHLLATAVGATPTSTYTLKWTENGVVQTAAVTVTAASVPATATSLIKPDASTVITIQLSPVTNETVTVAAVVQQLA